MSNEHIDLINIIIHGVLLLTKVMVVVMLFKLFKSEATPKRSRILIFPPNGVAISIFTILYIYCEVFFLYNFDKGIDLYVYEYVAMVDQIYLSVLVLLNLNKGESYGKVID